MKPNKENIITVLRNKSKGLYTKIIPKTGYYVYIIFNETTKTIIYVGKGKRNRVLYHFKNSDKYLNSEIKRLISSGQNIDYFIVDCFENEKDAYKYESFLINDCLVNDINIHNIAQTHKDIFIKHSFNSLVTLITKFSVTGNKTHENVGLSKQEGLNILVDILKKECQSYKAIAKRYSIFGFNVSELHGVDLINNIVIRYGSN